MDLICDITPTIPANKRNQYILQTSNQQNIPKQIRRRLTDNPLTIKIVQPGGSITIKCLGGPTKMDRQVVNQISARYLWGNQKGF